MLSDATMRRHLEAHLARVNAGVADLGREVDSALGTPLLIVAAGSVLQGFGNPGSDIDLHVLVHNARITDLPIPSRTLGVTVDVNYVDVDGARAAATTLTADAVLPDTRARWRSAQRRLGQLGRFALGLALDGDDEWRAWQIGLRPGVVAYAVKWRRADALRYRVAAELLAPTRPLTAAQRWCDAGLAALDALATDAGEAYVGSKWVGVKLERLGRTDLSDAYRRLLDTPTTVADCPRYHDAARAMLGELTAPWAPADPVVTVSAADGLAAWVGLGERALLHRYGLSGVECPPALARELTDPAWSWCGRLSKLDDDLRTLAGAGLLWLTARETS